jgi:hypothetical protein
MGGMSDEFGTVGAKKGDRAREISRLREHYRNHRDALSGLAGDAPSDHLASEYQRLVGEIDTAVRKLDELEGKPSTSPPTLNVDTNPMLRPTKTRPGATAPGTRPLMRTEDATTVAGAANPQSRMTLIIVAGLIVILGIAGLIWYASSGSRPAPGAKTTTVAEAPAPATNTTPPTISPASPPSALKITPSLADYGVIRKGTRAVRQFEVVNNSASPVDMQVARSACRCLYYDYKSKLAGGGKETITVTIDGARAKAGELREDVTISAKNDPSVTSTFTVQATVR